MNGFYFAGNEDNDRKQKAEQHLFEIDVTSGKKIAF